MAGNVIGKPSALTSLGMSPGERTRRVAAAKLKAERQKVDPEVRAALAAILEKREALMAEQQAAERAEREAQPDAILAVLQHASEDELAEFARRVGQMAPRTLTDMANDLLRQRQRSRQSAPQEAAEAAPAAKVSSSSRTR